jgi:hypothetical protein
MRTDACQQILSRLNSCYSLKRFSRLSSAFEQVEIELIVRGDQNLRCPDLDKEKPGAMAGLL